MSRKLFITIFLILIFLGLAGFISVRLGLFPVAFVNSWPIGESDFASASEEILQSYKDSQYIPDNYELKRLALQKVIEDKLVQIEARKYFSSQLTGNEKPDDVRALIQTQVNMLGSTFDIWLTKAKQRANIIILISGYTWSGKEVLACNIKKDDTSTKSLFPPISMFSSC